MEIKVLNIFEHFVSNIDGSVNGLYKIKINNNTYTVFRNGQSWGVLSHCLNKTVGECMSYMKDDMIKPISDAIGEYIKF